MGHNILIADDDRTTLTALKANLESAGYVVDTVANGKEALDRIVNNTPQLLITDVYMPELDAVDIYLELKKKNLMDKVKVIVMTAKTELEDNFKKLGVHGFIKKPYAVHDLLYQVRSCIGIPAIAGVADSPSAAAQEAVEAPIEEPKPPAEEKKQEKKREAPAQPSAKEETIKASPQAAGPANSDTVVGQGKKSVLVIESSDTVKEKMSNILIKKASVIEYVAKESDAIKRAKSTKPDVIFCNIVVKGLPTNNIIRFLRKLPEFKTTPMVSFIYADEKSFEGVSSMQIKHLMEGAKVSSLNAGINELIGEFDEATFLSKVKKYLS